MGVQRCEGNLQGETKVLRTFVLPISLMSLGELTSRCPYRAFGRH
jgi:hypothetical protein